MPSNQRSAWQLPAPGTSVMANAEHPGRHFASPAAAEAHTMKLRGVADMERWHRINAGIKSPTKKAKGGRNAAV